MDQKDREQNIYKVTIVGSVVNLLLLLLKFIAGWMGKSAAMMADAVHSLSDFATDIIVIGFVRVSSKPQDDNHEYGHGKYETFATLIIAVMLLVVGLGIFYDAGIKIVTFARGGTLQEPMPIAFIAAVASVASKEILFRYTLAEGRKLNSQAVIANAWHHRSDAFSSVGTMLGIGGAILLGGRWTVLDPIAALVVSVLIVKVAVQLIKPSMDELLEKSLPDSVEKEITDIILNFDGVSSPHNLRTRRIGNKYAIDVHIRMRGDITLDEAHDKATKIEHALKDRYGTGTYVGIHMEPNK